MRHLRLVMILLLLLTGCRLLSPGVDLTPQPTQAPTPTPMPAPATRSSEDILLTETQVVVDKMRVLCCAEGWTEQLNAAYSKSIEAKRNGEEIDAGALFIESLEARGERFDVNQYFDVLTHLSPEQGYVLDYVYFAPGGDGFPYIYARRASDPALADYSAYKEASPENYLDHIQVDGTPEGYFELAALSIMSHQFYLFWHANYNDKEVVSSQERLEEFIALLNEKYRPLTEEQEADILQLDVTPRVNFVGDKVRVRMLVFTKWGGFFEREFTIDRDFPHRMSDNDIELVPYNCGIMF
jgi:hypothetical protein